MTKYILDTNIFNRIVDGELNAKEIGERAALCATHVELNEVQNTKNDDRRELLLNKFESVDAKPSPTTSAVWGVSEWVSAEFTSKDSKYPNIVEELNKKNGGKDNNVRDALIADTAMSLGLTLVTEDRHLFEVVAEAGGSVVRLKDFLSSIDIKH